MSYEIIDEYFKALERLKNNTPIRLPKGSRINNDNVFFTIKNYMKKV